MIPLAPRARILHRRATSLQPSASSLHPRVPEQEAKKMELEDAKKEAIAKKAAAKEGGAAPRWLVDPHSGCSPMHRTATPCIGL